MNKITTYPDVHDKLKRPIYSWCPDIEPSAMEQVINLTNYPVITHVALMPDCHMGFGMPIGGVIACKNAVIPNAVGVDIGCGMSAVRTNIPAEAISKEQLRSIIDAIKKCVPMGQGQAHEEVQEWSGFDTWIAIKDELSHDTKCLEVFEKTWRLAQRNFGTLGGGNHFIELQKDEGGFLWIMLHSGSRNIGHKIASHYHNIAIDLNKKWHSSIPNLELSFLPTDSNEGQDYINDMNFALGYAQENRHRMMKCINYVIDNKLKGTFGTVYFEPSINIHHNYAALENHMGKNVWVHRKGATSAREGEIGIIPSDMGKDSPSYIVRGKGNVLSLTSCSHGAGRTMSRTNASKTLSREECDETMQGIVWDGFKKWKRHGKKKEGDPKYDLSEAHGAYKDIDSVMENQEDLVEIVHKLMTIAVLKG
jgi:tRNA-splicing ligase RtcB